MYARSKVTADLHVIAYEVKMIIVTDMKVIKTHDSKYHPFVYPIYHAGPIPVLGLWEDSENNEFCEVNVEMVKGRHFVNRFGIETIIGWDKQSQDLLGLPFEIFEKMEKRRESDYKENTRLRKSLREWEEMSFWQLIKRAITIAFTR